MATGRDLSLAHYVREAASAVTDLDSALIRSIVTVITKPGRLTAAYLAGDRHRYLTPFKVFLFCNLLYFVAVATFHFNVLTTSYRGQVDEMFYKNVTRSVIERRYGIHHVSAAVAAATATPRDPRELSLEARFNGATEGVGKASVVLLIPLFTLLLALLYIGSGRYVAEHAVFATHLVAALMIVIPLLGFLFLGIQAAIQRVAPTALDGEAVFILSLFAPLAVYVALAQRVAYGASWIANFARTGLLMASIALVIPAFKFSLFFITIYWIGR